MTGSQHQSASAQRSQRNKKPLKNQRPVAAPVSPIASEDWDKECEEAARKGRMKDEMERGEQPNENYTPTDSQSEGEYSVNSWSDHPLIDQTVENGTKSPGLRGQKRIWSLLEDSSEDSPGPQEADQQGEPPPSNAFLAYRSEQVVTPCKFNSSLNQLHSYDATDDTSEDEDEATADTSLPLTHDYQKQLEIKSASKPKAYVPPHKRPDFKPLMSPAEAKKCPPPVRDSFRFLSNDWSTPPPLVIGRGRLITPERSTTSVCSSPNLSDCEKTGFGRGRPLTPLTDASPVQPSSSPFASDFEMRRNSFSPGCWTLNSPCGPVPPNQSNDASSRIRILQAQQSMMARSRVSVSSVVSEMAQWKKVYQSRYFGLSCPFIDTHCHIDFIFKRTRFNGTYPQYLQLHVDTVPENYAGCVTVFCDPSTFVASSPYWRAIVEEKNVWATVGCHPKRVQSFTPQREDAMREMLQHPKMVALGEIGLDYSGNCGSYSFEQKQVFERQLLMAVELNKPIVIHCRDAEADCIEIMQKVLPHNHKIHRHCFTGTPEEARIWMHKFPNSYIGFTPLITQSSGRAFHPINAAAGIDLSKILIETDAPYFLPWVIPRGEMEYSHPGMAISVAWKIAQLKNLPTEEVLRVCLENAKDMYGI